MEFMGGKLMQSAGPLQFFPLSRCEAMGEGARRAGEGSLSQHGKLVERWQIARKSPHPASGHLLPRCAREKGNEGECFALLGVEVLLPAGLVAIFCGRLTEMCLEHARDMSQVYT